MKRGLGVYLTHIAVAVYLLTDGILGFVTRNGRIFGRLTYHSEIEDVLLKLLGRGDFTNILIVIFSVLAIIAGLFLLLELFQIRIPLTDTILLAFLIVWLLFIILIDIAAPLKDKPELLGWLKTLAAHIMVLGALVTATHRLGD
ncbi:MAG: hypothetical protein LBT87_07470 [Treponema sp.]|jgi:hypothetical protein|nr:hypothetical protein [Treponema sp.]